VTPWRQTNPVTAQCPQHNHRPPTDDPLRTASLAALGKLANEPGLDRSAVELGEHHVAACLGGCECVYGPITQAHPRRVAVVVRLVTVSAMQSDIGSVAG
jgi:hypothetical protein